MEYEQIVNNLIKKKNNSLNKQQSDSFKFLSILIKYIHENYKHGYWFVEIFYRHPHKDLPGTEEKNDYNNIIENNKKKIITLKDVEKSFLTNKYQEGFDNLFEVFDNAHITSKHMNNLVIYEFMNSLEPILKKIHNIFYENEKINNENIEKFVNYFYEKVKFKNIEDIYKFQDTLKKNKKRKFESIDENTLVNLFEKKIEELNEKNLESYKKKIESLDKTNLILKFENLNEKRELYLSDIEKYFIEQKNLLKGQITEFKLLIEQEKVKFLDEIQVSKNKLIKADTDCITTVKELNILKIDIEDKISSANLIISEMLEKISKLFKIIKID